MKLTNIPRISVVALLRVFGLASTWIYTSMYLNQVLNVPLFTVGVVYTISGVIAATAQIFGGRLGDRIGYRRLILTTFSLGIVSYSTLFLVTYTGSNALAVSLLFITGQTLSSVQRPSTNALLALSSDKPLRSFSILRVGANLGWGIGPATGGFVISYFGYPAIYLMGAVAYAVTAAIALGLVDKRPAVVEKKSPALSSLSLEFIILGICGLLIFMVQAQESVTLVNYASSIRHLRTSDLGFIYMANGIAVLLFQGIVYRISGRISITASFVTGALIYSAGYFTMSLDTALPSFIASMTILSVGEDFAFPMGNVIITKLYGNRNTGFYMGLYNAFLSAGRSLGPALGGFALSYLVVPIHIWIVATLPGFLSAAIFLTVFSRRLKKTGVMDV